MFALRTLPGLAMHRNVRALSRGLVLIGELNASGPSNVVQLAKRTGLNRTTCYRLLDTLREDGYVTFDETNALFGLTPQVCTLSEGVSLRDLSSQAALPEMAAGKDTKLKMIPYYAWSNRDLSAMQVWIPYQQV